MARTRLILSWLKYELGPILKDYALGRIYKLCSMVWGLVTVLWLLVGLVILLIQFGDTIEYSM
jgi:hypothetical protein